MVMRKVGFYAGAFDPVHDGHIEVARSALKYLDLDVVYFLVEEMSWTDKQPEDVAHRKAMVDLAIADLPSVQQLDMKDQQFSIAKTLKDIETQFPDNQLFFLFGADVFLRMNPQQWPGLDKLLKHNIVVFERKDTTESAITEHAKNIATSLAILPSVHPHHSSTDVRLNIHHKSLWVPQKIVAYIERQSLYA